MESKWYGYLFLTPLEATKHFHEVYRSKTIAFISAHKDLELANRVARKSLEQLRHEPAQFTQVWLARQRADRWAIPYDHYIDFCLEFWSRRAGRKQGNAPRPNQLGYTDASAEAWLIKFEKYMVGRQGHAAFTLASVPQLLPSAYQATREQKEARRFILEVCKGDTRPWADMVELWCRDHGIMRPLSFRSVMSREQMQSVIDTVRSRSLPPPPQPALSTVSRAFLSPSCYGMPGAFSPSDARCQSCVAVATCARFSNLVLRRVEQLAGHADPRKTHRLKVNSERTARYRARLKDQVSSGVMSLPV